ncbi:MAG: PDDEXK nuclease domain-containing protein [Candidatus Gastranaerophilaceae bacterium]|jgi:predicted nuclease of restriction endonuclease-like (RecB) superfamily
MNYYNEIKNKLIDNEVYKKVKDYSKNRNDLSTYYEVGKLLIKAQGGEERAKYGDNLIKEYSERLFNDTGRKYNITALKRIRQFYLVVEKGVPLAHQLTWSHYCELLPLKDINEINYYIKITIEQCLSKRQLRERIRNKEYQRLDDKTKLKLINKEEIDIKDNIKNPIIIKNKLDIDKEIVSEKILQRLILEDIPSFLEELGTGYSFIKNEYKIKLGERYNYIDLLLFNIEYNCYVVVELKVTELKKEHIGQIQIYMNYIDNSLRKLTQDKTIGLIICKKDNKYVIEYSSDKRILSREYELI